MTNKSRFKKAACFVLAAFGVLYLVNSCRPVHAAAADIQRLTVQETLAIIGDTFTAQYQSAGATYTTTFDYSGTGVIQPYQQNTDIDVLTGVPCLEYTAPVNYGSGGHIVMQVDIPFLLTNVSYLDFFFCPWVDLSRIGSMTFQEYSQYSFYLCSIGGVEQTPQTFVSSSDETKAGTFRLGGAYGSAGVSYCRASYYNTATSYSFISVSYDCSYAENLHTKIYIPCPLINSGYNQSGGSAGSNGSLIGSLTPNENGGFDADFDITVEQDYPEYFYDGGDAPVYDDDGYSQELAPVIDDADNAYEVVEDGLEVLSEMPMLPAWNYLDSILSLVPAFKALMIAAFILALYGWKIYR